MAIAPTDITDVGGAVGSLEEPAPEPRPHRTRRRRILDVLWSFCVGQGAVQVIGLLGGLLLVRRLSVEAYAQYGLATAFQSVVGVLMDLGFASTIVPLVGSRRDDFAVVGRYVRAAKHLRDRAFLLIAPVASIIFLAIMHQHHWHWGVQLLLLGSVLLALFSSGKVSYFSAPLLLHGRLRDFYAPQAATGTAKLGAYLLLAFTGALSAAGAAGLTAVSILVNGELLEKKAQRFMKWPKKESEEADREVLRYVLPSAPATIFAAFQPQLTVLLIGFFGGTSDLAQVAALGRIAQLFSVLMIFYVIVVEPYVARLDHGRLLGNFIGLLSLQIAGSVPVILLAFWSPQTFLWLLGAKFSLLRNDIGWFVLANCISSMAGLIWIMNRARKWVFWSGSALEIILLLLVQSAFLAFVGVRTVRQSVFFSLACSFCYVVAHGYVSIHGFTRDAKKASGQSRLKGIEA